MSVQQENQEGQFEDKHQVIDKIRQKGRIGTPVVQCGRLTNSISTGNSNTVSSIASEVASLTSTENAVFSQLTPLN